MYNMIIKKNQSPFSDEIRRSELTKPERGVADLEIGTDRATHDWIEGWWERCEKEPNPEIEARRRLPSAYVQAVTTGRI